MRHLTDEQTFTTGEIGKICEISAHTVKKRIDSGHLRGHRIPGSQDRRVRRSDLVNWMKEGDIPLSRLEKFERSARRKQRGIQVVLYSTNEETCSALVGAATSYCRRLRIDYANSAMGLALQLARLKPEIVLVDFVGDAAKARELCAKLKTSQLGFLVQIIGLVDGAEEESIEGVRFVSGPFEPRALIEKISHAALIA